MILAAVVGAILAATLRIVSLAPSLTEDLFAIGAGPEVVAVDSYSNRPAAAAKLPKIGSLRTVSAESILVLHPDLVVGIAYQAPTLADLARAGIHTETLRVDDLSEALAAVERLGVLTAHAAQARAVRTHIEADLRGLARSAEHARPLTAFVVIGRSPLYTAANGSYVDDLLRYANLRNVAGALGSPFPVYAAERLVADQPDLLVVPAPYAPLTGTPWDQLSAVRRRHIAAIPEDDLLRPGPNVARVVRDLIDATRPWR